MKLKDEDHGKTLLDYEGGAASFNLTRFERRLSTAKCLKTYRNSVCFHCFAAAPERKSAIAVAISSIIRTALRSVASLHMTEKMSVSLAGVVA